MVNNANPRRAAQADIVSDILRRVHTVATAGPGLTEQSLQRIESEVRQTWGGDRPYIARRVESAHADRNSRIERAYLAGQRLADLAQANGITPRHALRIIKAKPAATAK